MYELKNHTESVVKQVLRNYMDKNKLPCYCERCQFDILSLALNQFPSRYYVSAQGEVLVNCESQSPPDQARVMAALVNAVQQVAKFPSHSGSLQTETKQD